MELWINKQNVFAIALVCALVPATDKVQAGEVFGLKSSMSLAKSSVHKAATWQAPKQDVSLLGKIALFRGVSVEESGSVNPLLPDRKPETVAQQERRRPMVKAIYGGLQLSLQENLSLVYTPGRLSGPAINSGSQGLYLLSSQGGLANWFMGVESRSYVVDSDARRTANTAQFGVIVDLD